MLPLVISWKSSQVPLFAPFRLSPWDDVVYGKLLKCTSHQTDFRKDTSNKGVVRNSNLRAINIRAGVNGGSSGSMEPLDFWERLNGTTQILSLPLLEPLYLRSLRRPWIFITQLNSKNLCIPKQEPVKSPFLFFSTFLWKWISVAKQTSTQNNDPCVRKWISHVKSSVLKAFYH